MSQTTYMYMILLFGQPTEYKSKATYNYLLEMKVDKVETWTKQLGSKTEPQPVFSHSPHKENKSIKTENRPIPETDTLTCLGVTLDTRLTRKRNLENIQAKAT